MNQLLERVLQPGTISLQLHSEDKANLIKELIDLLDKSGLLTNRKLAEADIFAREQQLSTGLADGVALPHAKTDGVQQLSVAIGLKPGGIDFEALDENPSTLFVMAVIPKQSTGEHLEFISAISEKLQDEKIRKAVLLASSPRGLIDVLLAD